MPARTLPIHTVRFVWTSEVAAVLNVPDADRWNTQLLARLDVDARTLEQTAREVTPKMVTIGVPDVLQVLRSCRRFVPKSAEACRLLRVAQKQGVTDIALG